MTCCEVCDNDYDKAFEVHLAGRSHVFDSFECAIHTLQRNMARDLKNKGFTNVHLLAGGFDAWQQAGYPLESKEG